MPVLLRRFDHARTYNFCMGLWPFCFVLLPGLNIIARWGALDLATGELGPTTKSLVWLGIGVILCISRCAALAFSYVFPHTLPRARPQSMLPPA